MALIPFSDILKNPPSGKVYAVDTSFLISASKAQSKGEKDCHAVKRKLLAGGCGFAYNVSVRSEILHKVRLFLMQDAITQGKIRPNAKFKQVWNASQPHEKLKNIANSGFVESFRAAFGSNGEALKKELEGVLFGCTYRDTNSLSPRPSWDRVYAIMAIYGLDASDAMIINFAVSQKTFSGLITDDADFRFCGDLPDFDVILPDRALHVPMAEKWSS